jgi:hypothetical protein
VVVVVVVVVWCCCVVVNPAITLTHYSHSDPRLRPPYSYSVTTVPPPLRPLLLLLLLAHHLLLPTATYSATTTSYHPSLLLLLPLLLGTADPGNINTPQQPTHYPPPFSYHPPLLQQPHSYYLNTTLSCHHLPPCPQLPVASHSFP